MSRDSNRDLYEQFVASGDAVINVSPKKNDYSSGYRPTVSEFESYMDLSTPIAIRRAGSQQFVPSDIEDILEDANVVGGIEDVFAVNAQSAFSPTELEFIKASPTGIAKLRKLAKKLPDDSRNTLEQLLKELDKQ